MLRFSACPFAETAWISLSDDPARGRPSGSNVETNDGSVCELGAAREGQAGALRARGEVGVEAVASASRRGELRQIAEVDDSKAVSFELERGECSLHDSRIVHGAKPNTSPHRRCGYTMRYVPAASRVIPEKNPGHKVWLARGKPHERGIYENV